MRDRNDEEFSLGSFRYLFKFHITSGYIARKLSTPAKSRQPDQQRDPICPNIRVQKKRAHVQGATSEIC